jgi:hypothetical protein
MKVFLVTFDNGYCMDIKAGNIMEAWDIARRRVRQDRDLRAVKMIIEVFSTNIENEWK